MTELPDRPLDRFLEIYEALNRDRSWWSDASALRYATVAVLTLPGGAAEIAAKIRETAQKLMELRSSQTGLRASQLRFIVAALLNGSGDTPERFVEVVQHGRELFREAKLRRGGIYETMAILILHQQLNGASITSREVERFGELYEEMKRHHWWLTGPDDFPACAILVGQSGHAVEIGEKVEQIYQALRERGLAAGDPLQTAANILYLADKPASLVAERYSSLAEAFKQRGVQIWQTDYDELAILSFLDHSSERVAERVVEIRGVMAELKPDPGRLMTFNLASSIAFLELVQRDQQFARITDAKAMLDMQAVINAQNAAAISAATSASTTASSH